MTRTNNFDALRLLAALMVLCSHMAPLSGRIEWMWAGEHSLGNFGVLIFFSISGYLVSASWDSDPDLGRFLARRYLRMAPGLFVAMALTWVSISALGLHGFVRNPTHAVNGSLWTLPLEVYCYLLLAGAGVLIAQPLAFVAAMAAAYVLFPSEYLTYFGLFFAMGALFRAYPGLLVWLIVGLFSAIGAFVFVFNGHSIIALTFALPIATLWVGVQSWPVLRRAGRFGDLSYGIYVYAWPVQQVMVALLPKNFLLLLVSSIAASTALAWLSWRYVEAPALRLKPSRQRETGAKTASPAGSAIAGANLC